MATSITEIGKLKYTIEGDSKNFASAVKQARSQTEAELDRLTKKFVEAAHRQTQAVQSGNARQAAAFKGQQKQIANSISANLRLMQDHNTILNNLQPQGFIAKFQRALQQGTGNQNADALMALLGFSAIGAVALALGSKVVDVAGQVITTGIKQAIEAGVQAAEIEQMKVALTAVTGSAIEANQAMSEMISLSRTQPGLDFRTALQGVQRLRAVKFNAEEAKVAVEGLAKVRLLSGGTKQDLEAVLLNFQQIRSYGKLTGDELRETLMRMPYMGVVFDKAFGTINTEKIKDLNLTAEELFEHIFAAMKDLPEITGGAQIAWEKLINEIHLAQIAFGEPLLEPMTEAFRDLTALLQENQGVFGEWGKAAGEAITGTIALIKDLKNWSEQGGSTQQEIPTAEKYARFFAKSALIPGYLPFQLLRGYGQQANATKVPTQDLVAGPSVFKFNEEEKRKREAAEIQDFRQRMERTERQQAAELERIEAFYKQKESIISAQARFSADSEINYLQEKSELERAEYNEQLASMQSHYDKRVKILDAYRKSFPEKFQHRVGSKELAELEKERAKIAGVKGSFAQQEAGRLRQIEEVQVRELDKIFDRRLSMEETQADRVGRIREAGIRSVTARTLEGEREQNRQIFEIRNQLITDSIQRQTEYYNNLAQLYAGDAGKVREIESEKYEALQKLNHEYQLNLIEEAQTVQRITEQIWQQGVQDRRAILDDQLSHLQNLGVTYQQLGDLFTPERLVSQPLDRLLGVGNVGEFRGLTKEFLALNLAVGQVGKVSDEQQEKLDKMQARIKELSPHITRQQEEIYNLAELLGKSGDFKFFDEFGQKALALERIIAETQLKKQITAIGEEIKIVNERIAKEEARFGTADSQFKTPAELTDFTDAKRKEVGKLTQSQKLLEEQLRNTSAAFDAKAIDLYSNSIVGLDATLTALRTKGSVQDLANKYLAGIAIRQEQVGVLQEIAIEEARLGESSAAVADRIRLAHLRTANEIKARYEDAMIAIDKAQQEMADKAVYHHERVMASILDAVASAPGITEIMEDLGSGAVLDFYKLLDDSVGAFVEKLGLADTALGNFFQTFLAGLAKLAAQQIFWALFGGGQAGGAGGGQQQGGGWWSTLINWGIRAVGAALGGAIAPTSGGANNNIGGPQGIFGVPAGIEAEGVSGGFALAGKAVAPDVDYKQLPRSGGDTFNPTFVFQANPQTGAFSQESAEQATRKLLQMQRKVASR